MGKTKLNTIPGETTQDTSGKAEYEMKKAAKAAKETGSSEKEAQVETVDAPQEAPQAAKPASNMPTAGRGKDYLAARSKVDPTKNYSLAEAAKLVKDASYSKFAGSVELHMVLNINTLNTRIELPHSTGSAKKVEITSDDTVKKLQAGKIDFDVLLASPQTMSKLVPFARLLGPKGLMPNPKNGTLIDNPEKAVEKFSGNAINVRTEKSAPLLHLVVAKTSQPESEIEDNIKAVISGIEAKNIEKAVIAPSMGPSIRLAL